VRSFHGRRPYTEVLGGDRPGGGSRVRVTRPDSDGAAGRVVLKQPVDGIERGGQAIV
jgi:hypothetical protein